MERGREREEELKETGSMSFITGDKVEVCSDEEGFRGAWFEATIARSKPRLRRYVVDYDTLVSEDDKSRPLRETVECAHVRPRPPRRPDLDAVFAVHQAVDAYYNDGWWSGVVSKASENGGKAYIVRFPTTGEEMEFEPSDLRALLHWVNGEWLSTERQRHLEMEFTEGKLVEVSSDEEGFIGAWFTAVVIQSVGEKKYLVEYRCLKTDDGSKLLREIVDSLHIRPIPPDIPVVGNFKLLEEVDVLYNDGWWVGVISKVLRGLRYLVYFRHSKEELVYGHRELRLHQDWINGRWVRASQALGL